MAAVVPCWHGERLSGSARGFVEWVKVEFGEVLLHGYTHHRADHGGAIGLLTGNANEFTRMGTCEAIKRLRCGQAILAEVFGQPANGFVPPAWQRGPITSSVLVVSGFRYSVGFTGVESVEGERIPLCTWSWDAGVFGPLGVAGEAVGSVLTAVHPEAVPCVVFHPLDVERGFLPRGMALVKKFLAEGRRPVTFGNLFECLVSTDRTTDERMMLAESAYPLHIR